MFCIKSNSKKLICKAKGEIIRSYLNSGIQMFQVMMGIEQGLIKLDDEAELLIIRRKRAANKASKQRNLHA